MAKDRLTVSIDEGVSKRLEDVAEQQGRSKSNYIEHQLRESFESPLEDRPDTLLAGLLWDARRDIHTFVLIGVIAYAASLLATGVLGWFFLALSAGYALTVVVGAVDALLFDRALTLWLARRDAPGTADGVEA